LGQTAQGFGLRWTWLPLPNGKYPRGEAHKLLAAALPLLSSYLDDGDSILIHCAAGIHRTGMLAYGLLRWRGYGKAEALDLISQMRTHTRNGLHPRHVLWGDNVIAGVQTPPPDDDAVPEEIFDEE
jgi:protein-tyrosine phosphatase